MPSITTTDGYTFSNLGPVTTTFTAPASCSTAINNYGIGTSDLLPGFVYNVQCTRGGYNGCLPTGTVPDEDIGIKTKTVVVNGTTSTDFLVAITDTHPVTSVTTTFAAEDVSDYGAVSMQPMLHLVHRQSDLKATGTIEAGSTAAASTTATSTSNSAARVVSRTNSWDGLGGVLGVSVAAMILGAAIVFQ
jgi:hypothetical protein